MEIKNQIKKIGLFSLYVLIVLTTLFGAIADEIPVVQLEDTTGISYLNIFNYNTSIHNNLTELQGGLAPNEYYHLNYAEYVLVTTILSNVSFNLGMLDLQEGYIYVGNESNNPEGELAQTFIFNAVNNGTFYLLSNPCNFYNESDFDIDDYYTGAEILGFSYYNASDFDIDDYSTTAEADNLYAPINYGDGWNKTYADTLYTNETDTTYANVSFDLSQLANTGNVNIGAHNFSVNTSILFVDSENDGVGIGTDTPNSRLHIKANIPGTVGSHPAGQLIIQNPVDSVLSNVVITAYESDGDGNPDQQLWYLGSQSVSNSDIIFLNRRNSNLYLGTNNIARMTILNDGNIKVEENIIADGNVTAEYIKLEGNTTFEMYANNTCWVIKVDTTYFEVCK